MPIRINRTKPVPPDVPPPTDLPPPPVAISPQPVIDPSLVELRAFRARYKNRFKTGEFAEPNDDSKKRTRDDLAAKGISPKWTAFVARFGFSGEIPYALFRVLESPGRCSPGWFVEAEIAVRRAGLDPSALAYPVIKTAIENWRAERRAGQPVEAGQET